jgi:hypothetical protein
MAASLKGWERLLAALQAAQIQHPQTQGGGAAPLALG